MLAGQSFSLEEERRDGKEHTALFRSVFDAAIEFIGLCAPDGTLLAANNAALRFAGLTEADVIGRPFWEAPWWSTGSEVQARLIRAIRTAAAGEPDRFEADVRGTGDTVITIDFSITPMLDGNGRVEFLVPEGRDISQYKRVERALRQNHERLQTLLDGSIQGILVHRGLQVLYANQRYLEMFGFETLEQFQEQGLDSVLPAEARPLAAGVWDSIARGERPEPVRRVPNLRRDGSVILVDVLARQIQWDGQPAVLATVIDVTDQVRAEQAEAARLAAEAASRAKSAFLACMTHELRTPLNAIMGFSEVLSRELGGTVDGRLAGFADDIVQAAQHLTALVNDLLDLSRIEARKVDLRPEPVDVAAELHRVLRIAAGLAKEKPLDYRLDLPDGPPPVLQADPRALRQILLNVVGNAVKFTPAGGRITLSATRDGDGGLALAVSDTGVGIPAQDQARVWEPFGRAEVHASGGIPGTGLGLAIARSLAELHGACASLDSREGQGTRISFRFPPECVGALA